MHCKHASHAYLHDLVYHVLLHSPYILQYPAFIFGYVGRQGRLSSIFVLILLCA